MTTKTRARSAKPLNLALQGGGTHGAFTWGVLDRLLEQEDIEIGRISGSSAGALNGAALATGLARGGRGGAREHLAQLWDQIAQAGALMSFLLLPLRKPGMGIWDDALPLFSPHQTNPLGTAPLRAILNRVIDEDLLRAATPGNALFVNAVDVNTGAPRVFGPSDISIDALLASACAPFSYQAVQIDGNAYWDGSYVANPSLWPLYENQMDTDILLVELTPLQRAETPQSAKNILNRINELASVNGLVSEIRAIDGIRRDLPGTHIRMHVVSLPDQPAGAVTTEPSVKRTVGRVLFEMLRQEGRRACDDWLSEHAGKIGLACSVDIATRYLRPFAQTRRTAQA